MAELNVLEDKMKAAMAQAKECIDLSIEMIEKEPDTKKVIYKHWENFLYHFFEYAKAKEKESGQEIVKEISLKRFLKFL